VMAVATVPKATNILNICALLDEHDEVRPKPSAVTGTMQWVVLAPTSINQYLQYNPDELGEFLHQRGISWPCPPPDGLDKTASGCGL
jgi:hypothetical protein